MSEFRAGECLCLANLAKKEEHDVVVVGSGPGGSLTACLLAEAGREPLVLEEGLHRLPEEAAPFSADEMKLKYRNGGLTMAFGRPPVQYVEGFCLGGGSEVNSGLYHRLPEDTLKQWGVRNRLQDWSPELLERQARIIEKDLSVSLLPAAPPTASLIMREGAEALGWKCLEVPRWQNYDKDAAAGERQTMTKTFLPRAIAAGARVVTDARVNKLKRDKGSWLIKVETGRLSGQTTTSEIRAKTVFLGAGAIGTPSLLRRSGLGRRAGHFLHMHPTIKIAAEFDRQVNDLSMGVPVHQVKEFPRLSFGCSISSPHYLSVAMMDHLRGLEMVRDRWKNLAVYYAMIVPEGHGRIWNLPSASSVASISLSRRDMSMLSLGLERLGQLLFAAGAVRLYPSVSGLGPFEKLSDLKSIPAVLPASGTSLMTIHLTSSCAMSGLPDFGVTDSWGAVYGEKNLHVTDASLLCTAPGVNPQGPMMAVVRRNVERWLQ